MTTRQKGKRGSMALKLDMAKTFVRVEWDFLEAIMRQMSFSERWISLMMICIKTVSYIVLINGKPGRTFYPSRGIQQGDPLSPYLFLLCAEGRNALLSKAEREG